MVWRMTIRNADEVSEGSRLPNEEIARPFRAMYEQDIRHQVEANHHGEVIAIDVDSGSWAVADEDFAAVVRLREIRPDAFNVLCEVGY